MAIENVQQLLVEQLGKNGSTEVFTTAAQTSKDWYCVYFPVESVVASIAAADATGETALQTTLPAGYCKYEAYEVSWAGEVTIGSGNAPATETDVLSPAASNKGVVQGLVTKGKMYVAEKDGTEQVQYTQRQEPAGTNYIYYGQ